MTSRQPKIDPQLGWLRAAHRSERAPEALRQRALDAASALPARTDSARQARPSVARRAWWGIGFATAAGLGLGVLHYVIADDAVSHGLLAARQSRGDVVPAVEPSAPKRVAVPGCTPPLPTSRWSRAEADAVSKLPGLQLEVFEQQTRCGLLRRRYLVRMPPTGKSASGNASAPVLIVLPTAGQSAEQAPVETRGRFDDLAQREGAVLVYANGSPSLEKTEDEPINAGVWQIDDDAHPAVDDVAYLQGVVEHLRKRRGLDPAGDVFLAGYGSGAWMALAAAAREPTRYAGVAVFLPNAGDPSSLSKGIASGGRTRVFVQVPHATEYGGAVAQDRSAFALSWSAALGGEPGPVRVQAGQDGEQIDTTSGAVALRLRGGPVPEVLLSNPSAADRVAIANASFFDGAKAAWAFWHETEH